MEKATQGAMEPKVTIKQVQNRVEVSLERPYEFGYLVLKDEGLARGAVTELAGIFASLRCHLQIERQPLELVSFDNFISQPVSARNAVIEYLADAKHYIQQDAPEGAIWRLEEALKLLRRMAAKEGAR